MTERTKSTYAEKRKQFREHAVSWIYRGERDAQALARSSRNAQWARAMDNLPPGMQPEEKQRVADRMVYGAPSTSDAVGHGE